jgi:hypothetical protein
MGHIGELPQQVESNLPSLERITTQLRLKGENQIRALDGADVCGPDSPMGIGPAPGATTAHGDICAGPRVGISQAADRPWRYWLADDGHVSVFRPSKPRATRPKPVSGSAAKDGTMHR